MTLDYDDSCPSMRKVLSLFYCGPDGYPSSFLPVTKSKKDLEFAWRAIGDRDVLAGSSNRTLEYWLTKLVRNGILIREKADRGASVYRISEEYLSRNVRSVVVDHIEQVCGQARVLPSSSILLSSHELESSGPFSSELAKEMEQYAEVYRIGFDICRLAHVSERFLAQVRDVWPHLEDRRLKEKLALAVCEAMVLFPRPESAYMFPVNAYVARTAGMAAQDSLRLAGVRIRETEESIEYEIKVRGSMPPPRGFFELVDEVKALASNVDEPERATLIRAFTDVCLASTNTGLALVDLGYYSPRLEHSQVFDQRTLGVMNQFIARNDAVRRALVPEARDEQAPESSYGEKLDQDGDPGHLWLHQMRRNAFQSHVSRKIMILLYLLGELCGHRARTLDRLWNELQANLRSRIR